MTMNMKPSQITNVLREMEEVEESDARWKILIEANKDSSIQRLAKHLLVSLALLYKSAMIADVGGSMEIIEENLKNFDKVNYKPQHKRIGAPRICWGPMARETLAALRRCNKELPMMMFTT